MATTFPTPEGVRPGRAADEGPPRPAGAPGRRSLPVLAAFVAAAWLVPAALVPLGLGIVVLPILLLAVASVIRVGGGLLDRLVVAGLIVVGSVLVSGLLFSLWPWGLSPVATSGTLLTAVAVTGWLARRRPRIPLRVRPSDLIVLGTAGVFWRYLHHPLAGKSAAERLSFFSTAEDRLNHFSYFSGIQHVGGYNFLHQEEARAYMMSPAEVTYPQGTHFLLAWVDSLVHSSADPGAMLGVMNRYLLYVLVAYTLLATALVWAARWIGGPRLRGWRTAAVCGTVMALMLASNYTYLVIHGFDSTIIGLLMFTVTLALLIRPAMGRAEYALVALAGLITVTYVYNLFGAAVGLAVVLSVLVHRRRFAGGPRRWLRYALMGAVGLGLAGLPSAVSVLSELDVASTASLGGPSVEADRTLLVGGMLLALFAALAPTNRRTGAGQAHLAVVLGTGAVVFGFGWYQINTLGEYSYYFEKLAGCAIVVALISLGAVGSLLRTPAPVRSSRGRRLATDGVLSGLAVATALSLFAGMQWNVHSFKGGPVAWHTNSLIGWSRGDAWSDIGPRDGATVLADLKDIQGPVMALYSNDDYKNLKSTWLAALLRERGGDMLPLYETHWINIGAAPRPEPEYQAAMEHVRLAITKVGQPLTIVVVDRGLADRMGRDIADAGLKATVVTMPDNQWIHPWNKSFPGD
ncbi:hypothetical protein ACFVUH_06480 [Kitasatospora sp. NPDC058032]|uniref:hypothetical protein n=1 Tax=Kitasatospora sp. NPDC058032 TaxID=3346307 RepID=UPI0036D836FF